VQGVALGERNDVGLFRSLLNIGVRDYLVKPVTIELLKRTVNLAHGSVNPVVHARTGKPIAFVGTRGGVGVTTIALNLARYLSGTTHRRVAYVDLNLSGGQANSMLGTVCNNGLSEVLQNAHRLDPQFVERTLVGLDGRLSVLATEQDFDSHADVEPASLARVLELLCQTFHYVFIDVDRPDNPLATAAFNLAKRVYIVADRSVYSARQAMRLLRYVEERDSSPQTSILLNNPNGALHGKVEAGDFAQAIGRVALVMFAFEPKSLQAAENLAEAPKERSQLGFNRSIELIANDLTGQLTKSEASWLDKLRLRRR
jgi:pilus assembly protein CpaE